MVLASGFGVSTPPEGIHLPNGALPSSELDIYHDNRLSFAKATVSHVLVEAVALCVKQMPLHDIYIRCLRFRKRMWQS
jgi:hypothetical protein